MDFWNSYKARMVGSFGTERLFLGTSERKNASLRAISEFSVELELNKAFLQRYDAQKRYIIAKDMTHDLLFCAYDVNSKSIFVARNTRTISQGNWKKLFATVGRMAFPNLELRLIGLQNGDLLPLKGFENIWKRVPGSLVEADLFGQNIRNVAIDTKTGMTYNILMLNRIYRAGELTNSVSGADFDQRLGELSFV